MNRAFCCLLLAALPGSSQVGSIAIYTQFQHEPPKAVLSAIQEEASALMAPAGLRLQWKSLPSTGHDVSSAVAVVTFQGRCTVANPRTQPTWDTRLGWSHVSNGEVLPFAGIDCDSILGFVYERLLAAPTWERDQVLGREIRPAAGPPWYLTLFGRDSLWAARMALPFGTDLAVGTLRALARRQGSVFDSDRAEAPGKIPHELRRTTYVDQIGRAHG